MKTARKPTPVTTVGELIETLQTFNPNWVVGVDDEASETTFRNYVIRDVDLIRGHGVSLRIGAFLDQ